MLLKLKLDWCSFKAAKYAVTNWHYSKSMPVGKLVKLGVWEYDKFIGCIIFGRGANNNMAKPYNLKQIECCELVRIALTKHQTQVTRIVSIAIKMLKKLCPKLKLIISYADPEHGHHGGIYQGGNWLYDGLSNSVTEYILNGKRMHGRSMSSLMKYKSSDQLANAKKVAGSRKHRYLYPLDKSLILNLKDLKKPRSTKASYAFHA